jgi:hypothetical protein
MRALFIAYDAARTLSLMVVRAAGYRPRSAGAHFHTFAAPEAADEAFVAISVYFDGCRIQRKVSEYEVAGGVTDTDADSLLKTVKQFAINAEAWIKAHRTPLA